MQPGPSNYKSEEGTGSAPTTYIAHNTYIEETNLFPFVVFSVITITFVVLLYRRHRIRR